VSYGEPLPHRPLALRYYRPVDASVSWIGSRCFVEPGGEHVTGTNQGVPLFESL
jgi:hypothetical protein